jgi:hypothetical protein
MNEMTKPVTIKELDENIVGLSKCNNEDLVFTDYDLFRATNKVYENWKADKMAMLEVIDFVCIDLHKNWHPIDKLGWEGKEKCNIDNCALKDFAEALKEKMGGGEK